MTAESDVQASNKRSALYIDRPFQASFLRFCLLIALTVSVVFYLANLFFFWRASKIGFELGFPPQHPYFQIIETQRSLMNLIFAGTATVSASVIVALGIRFSHRIAGPLVNLSNFLNDVADGKPARKLVFRKGDFFQNLADSANRAVGDRQGERETSSGY